MRSADQIELVDMSPQALRRRMAHGNIYTADKIDAALSRYFREGNLTALRELALLWLADRVDEGLERYREQHEIDSTWATRERIVVPVSGGPGVVHTHAEGGADRQPPVRRGVAGAVRHPPGRPHRNRARPADPARRQGRRARRHLPHRRRRRPGRRDPRLRPRRERHPDRHRRQPPWPGLDPAATGVGERVVTGSGDIDVHIVTHDYVGRASLQPAASTPSAGAAV